MSGNNNFMKHIFLKDGRDRLEISYTGNQMAISIIKSGKDGQPPKTTSFFLPETSVYTLLASLDQLRECVLADWDGKIPEFKPDIQNATNLFFNEDDHGVIQPITAAFLAKARDSFQSTFGVSEEGMSLYIHPHQQEALEKEYKHYLLHFDPKGKDTEQLTELLGFTLIPHEFLVFPIAGKNRKPVYTAVIASSETDLQTALALNQCIAAYSTC
jgi:hypothetical protein